MICTALVLTDGSLVRTQCGSQVDSHEGSGPLGLCPCITPMTLVNSLTWSPYMLGGGRAEVGVESRVKYKSDCVILVLKS